MDSFKLNKWIIEREKHIVYFRLCYTHANTYRRAFIPNVEDIHIFDHTILDQKHTHKHTAGRIFFINYNLSSNCYDVVVYSCFATLTIFVSSDAVVFLWRSQSSPLFDDNFHFSYNFVSLQYHKVIDNNLCMPQKDLFQSGLQLTSKGLITY